jgi:hypothetical protein
LDDSIYVNTDLVTTISEYSTAEDSLNYILSIYSFIEEINIINEQSNSTIQIIAESSNTTNLIDTVSSLLEQLASTLELNDPKSEQTAQLDILTSIEEILEVNEYSTAVLAIVSNIIESTFLYESIEGFHQVSFGKSRKGTIVVSYDKNIYITNKEEYIFLVQTIVNKNL